MNPPLTGTAKEISNSESGKLNGSRGRVSGIPVLSGIRYSGI